MSEKSLTVKKQRKNCLKYQTLDTIIKLYNILDILDIHICPLCNDSIEEKSNRSKSDNISQDIKSNNLDLNLKKIEQIRENLKNLAGEIVQSSTIVKEMKKLDSESNISKVEQNPICKLYIYTDGSLVRIGENASGSYGYIIYNENMEKIEQSIYTSKDSKKTSPLMELFAFVKALEHIENKYLIPNYHIHIITDCLYVANVYSMKHKARVYVNLWDKIYQQKQRIESCIKLSIIWKPRNSSPMMKEIDDLVRKTAQRNIL